jgi:hypothetical protein
VAKEGAKFMLLNGKAVEILQPRSSQTLLRDFDPILLRDTSAHVQVSILVFGQIKFFIMDKWRKMGTLTQFFSGTPQRTFRYRFYETPFRMKSFRTN